ncbi:hypothetical protein BC827DRAFT_1262681 [Russula dissimulans]|nr:hypothetical protein BC827DRAFT_1262681 [Russula dissimulans]
MIHRYQIEGVTIPGTEKTLKKKLFADNTNLYMSWNDQFDHVQKTLKEWCKTSGARFNIEKMEIIPIGSEEHRQQIITSRKINNRDHDPLPGRINIAKDGEAIRILGAWTGNHVNNITPWEIVIDKIKSSLEQWKRTHPNMSGRRLITQAIIGGHTQFLTQVQGMPATIEKAIANLIRNFMWEDDSSPRIAVKNC